MLWVLRNVCVTLETCNECNVGGQEERIAFENVFIFGTGDKLLVFAKQGRYMCTASYVYFYLLTKMSYALVIFNSTLFLKSTFHTLFQNDQF